MNVWNTQLFIDLPKKLTPFPPDCFPSLKGKLSSEETLLEGLNLIQTHVSVDICQQFLSARFIGFVRVSSFETKVGVSSVFLPNPSFTHRESHIFLCCVSLSYYMYEPLSSQSRPIPQWFTYRWYFSWNI